MIVELCFISLSIPFIWNYVCRVSRSVACLKSWLGTAVAVASCVHSKALDEGERGVVLRGKGASAAHSTGQFIFIFALWDCAASTVATSEPLSIPHPLGGAVCA